MIRIDNFEKEYILDLNENPYDEHILTIESRGDKGNNLPWAVELINNSSITAVRGTGDTLHVTLDVEELKSDAFIVLRNYKKERLKIFVKHNALLSAPKTYKFRISKKSTDGRKTKIRILSKENNKEIGWKCTYDGKPLNYSITPMESDKSGNVEIELIDELFTNISSVIEFTQEKSGEKISLYLNQDNNNTNIIKAD
jgi:hypothetical protein